MRWEPTIIGEYFEVKHGFAFKGEFFGDAGSFVVVTPGSFLEEGGFKYRGSKEKFYTTSPPQDYILSRGDLIVAMTEQSPGLLGSSAWVPDDNRYLHNQRIGLFTNVDERHLAKSFLYYLMNSHPVRQQIQATATGAKVKHTAPTRIQAVKVPLPPVAVQRRIADILSAYDDLIENNNRRMALLEESIHLLYREWFVYLRFPGHERVEVVDGVPEGWVRTSLGSLLTLQRGFDLPKKRRTPGHTPVLASTGFHGMHNQAKASGPGVVTGRSGSLGVVTYVHTDYWPLNTTLWVRELHDITTEFAYTLLSDVGLEKFRGGAAVPTLNRNAVHTAEVLRPPVGMVADFSDVVRSSLSQKRLLEQTNDKLREARDLLLPRLMDGRIPV